MRDDSVVESSKLVSLENYTFSGLDASLIGAIKSVADYYQLPLTAAWIYGMTGYAFLHILDEKMAKPNIEPSEPEVFKLARNLGIEITGFHVYAEGENFKNLQRKAWEKAKTAIRSKQPVFAKNIDIRNQTSVIYAYDDIGYYTKSWHTGYEHSEDVIPWDALGLGLCPCTHCVNSRKDSEYAELTSGLLSLHTANPIEAADEQLALKDALEFVIRLNEKGIYNREGQLYFVGQKAYERWLTAIDSNELNRYYFSLFVEILNEGRQHVVQFLSEIKEKFTFINPKLIDEGITLYNEISLRFITLNNMYPYEEPPVFELIEKERCVFLVTELMSLEKKALIVIKEILDYLQ
ncbi:hypothetical protein KHA96_08960 [Bacillus sp. FJAT-49711]|uniref:hypothetical protein n=1 Tax=Bacillus sp. FJAT-49711 TaxID=2833585 RepID=UPI001BCA0170|nr:hypothetical protein [Bacillus sp. FJAT-49711]MBS4218439.1 hypothetical protein [Bacillus sp. FJAT-49711]